MAETGRGSGWTVRTWRNPQTQAVLRTELRWLGRYRGHGEHRAAPVFLTRLFMLSSVEAFVNEDEARERWQDVIAEIGVRRIATRPALRIVTEARA